MEAVLAALAALAPLASQIVQYETAGQVAPADLVKQYDEAHARYVAAYAAARDTFARDDDEAEAELVAPRDPLGPSAPVK